MDHGTREEIEAKYANDVTVTRDGKVPFIHYVWKGQPYKELVQQDRFGMILASHVVEHVPDLVGYLNQVADILIPGGVLRLAVPDKRYCFDARRRLSTRGDIIEAHLEQRKRPSVRAAYDFFLYSHTLSQQSAHLDTTRA